MRHTGLAHATAIALSLLTACAAEPWVEETDLLGEDGELAEVVPVQGAQTARARGRYIVVPPAPAEVPDELYAGAPQTFYLNRSGGTFTPGFNDSRTNRTTVPGTTSVIDPWSGSDAEWQAVMACSRAIWAPFDVIITDVDPGDAPHVEAVVAGRPGDVGLADNVLGVSPFAGDCSTIPNAIVYTFAELLGSNTQLICEVTAQELAHAFGLDHEFLCEDPMTYLEGCGAKSFRAEDAPCGEFEPRECYCGASTQNSVELLLQRIGPSDGIAPSVTIAEPADGATVAPGFRVVATAADAVAVILVELYIDGTRVASLDAPPFEFDTAVALGGATHTIELRASDGVNVGIATATVTVLSAGGDTPQTPAPDDDPPAADGDDDGRQPGAEVVGGCAAAGGAGAWWTVALALAALGCRRRRSVGVARRP
jgi:hypothetical protein